MLSQDYLFIALLIVSAFYLVHWMDSHLRRH